MTTEDLDVGCQKLLLFLIVSITLIFSWSYLAVAFCQNDDPYLTIAAAVVFSAMVMLASIMGFAAILFCRREEKKDG